MSFESSHERAIDINVVASCIDLFQELTNVMIDGVTPLAELMTLAESAAFILLHPFCLDREDKTYHALENCVSKLVLDLNKSLHLGESNRNDHLVLDLRELTVAISFIRLLIETKEAVQIKIESVVASLHVLSNNFVSRYLFPSLAEIWKHYNPQVPESALCRKAFVAEG